MVAPMMETKLPTRVPQYTISPYTKPDKGGFVLTSVFIFSSYRNGIFIPKSPSIPREMSLKLVRNKMTIKIFLTIPALIFIRIYAPKIPPTTCPSIQGIARTAMREPYMIYGQIAAALPMASNTPLQAAET